MTEKNKKQFGVWMDSRHATIVGRENIDTGNFVVLAHAISGDTSGKPSEKTTNNSEKGAMQKFFKEITTHMQNVEEIHVTGTGTAQEQFIHYMAATPQFKNTIAKESTSNKMGDETLLKYITEKFN
jgi:stalled ribosome rescue protein Dom34